MYPVSIRLCACTCLKSETHMKNIHKIILSLTIQMEKKLYQSVELFA